MSGPDFLTVDAFLRPPGGRIRWRRNLRRAIDEGIDGLRGSTVNHANDGTRSLVPRLLPRGVALVAAWDSAGAAEAAFAGPLRWAIDGPGRFSLDAEIVRVKIGTDSEVDHWHGWRPSAEGAEPLVDGEPMVAIVHGILRRGRLMEFLRNNLHAASRAAHHPGHRGSIDVSSQLPYEHTSISLWRTYALAQDFAYKKGGHASAMTHALQQRTHRASVFLQARPLASSGTLGIDKTPYPKLPEARRAGI